MDNNDGGSSSASSGDEGTETGCCGDGKPHRYMLHIAYLGTNFVGWQRQLEASADGKSSVQELVENVVTDVLRADRRVNVTSVSRTDAGTHALYVRAVPCFIVAICSRGVRLFAHNLLTWRIGGWCAAIREHSVGRSAAHDAERVPSAR